MCLAQRKHTKLLFVHPFDLKDRLKSFSIPKRGTFAQDHQLAGLEKNKPISQLFTPAGSLLPCSAPLLFYFDLYF